MDITTIEEIKNTLVNIYNNNITNWYKISGIKNTSYDELIDSIRLSTDATEEDDPDNIDYIIRSVGLTPYLKYIISNNIKNSVELTNDISYYGSDSSFSTLNTNIQYAPIKSCKKYLKRLFKNNTKLLLCEDLDLTNVISTESMFEGCTVLVECPEFQNVTKNTTCKAMFQGCSMLKTIKIPISSYTTNLQYAACNTTPDNIEFYGSDLSAVKYMDYFAYSSGVSSIITIPATPALTSAAYFTGSTKCAGWIFTDMSKVTNLSTAFEYCNHLELPELPSITNIQQAFSDNYLGSDGLFVVPKMNPETLVNMNSAFNNNINITTESAANLWNTEWIKVTDMNTVNTRKGYPIGGVFYNCIGLTGTINFYTPNLVSDSFGLFEHCTNVEIFNVDFRNAGTSPYVQTDVVNSGSYNISSDTGLNTYSVGHAFDDCTSATEINLTRGLHLTDDIWHHPFTLDSYFKNDSKLQTVTGLDVSDLMIDWRASVHPNASDSEMNKLNAAPARNVFYGCTSLINCVVHGTLYKSGLDLSACGKLSDESITSFLTATYDWKTNPESKNYEWGIDMSTTFPSITFNSSRLDEFSSDDEHAALVQTAKDKGWLIISK